MYGLLHLPTHLKRSGEEQLLKDLLLDYSWLQAKLAATGVHTLLTDYDLLADDTQVLLVRDSIGLAAQILSTDQAQLPSQLWGRLGKYQEA